MKSNLARGTALVVVSALHMGSVSAQAAATPVQCLSVEEATAEKVRRLKTTLMVGALQCQSALHLRVSENYNSFVKMHGLAIQGHDRKLSNFFKRAFGNGHRKAMDRHMTSTANKVAGQSYKTVGFCEKIAALANASLTASPLQLLAVAESNVIATARLPACAAPTLHAAQVLPLR